VTTLDVNTREQVTIHLLRTNELLEERAQILQAHLDTAQKQVLDLQTQLTETQQKLREYESVNAPEPKLFENPSKASPLTN